MKGFENRILHGDCLDWMVEFPDNVIDLTVTSPPYDDLRKYKGYSLDFESVAKELYRVTKEGGVVVWVVGDKTHKGSETGTSFKQALYFKEIGFNLHDTMIFKKRNPLPQVKKKRYMNEFEYMFILSKGKPNTCNYIMIPSMKTNEKRKTMSYKKFSTGEQKRERTENKTQDMKVKGNIWEYSIGNACSSDDLASKHPAIFPEKLAEDHILSWSNPGDLVFDPFTGSATTLKMAELNGRRWIGIEMSWEYCNIANERIRQAKEQKENSLK